MQFVLCSTNEAKRQATEAVLKEIYGNNFTLKCVDVDSGVSVTPTTDEEGIQGSLNRILSAEAKLPDHDGYIGLEGIITTNSYGTFICGWAVLKLQDGTIGYGCSAKVRLPDELMKGFDSFRELSEMTAKAYPKSASKLPTLGTNGVITNGMYTRVDEFTDALKCAVGSIAQKY